MEDNKVLMIIAPNNFRDEEYFEPKRVLEENGFEVVSASLGVDVAVSRFDKRVKVNLDLKDVVSSDYVGVVFVGGGGALVYEKDTFVHGLIDEFNSAGKVVSAICIAPRILGASGILMGKKVTMWNGDSAQRTIIENYGAEFVDSVDVVQDGRIVTGNGPVCAEEFGKKIVEVLKD